jgi:hypothetical protein
LAGNVVKVPIHPYEILTIRVDYPNAGDEPPQRAQIARPGPRQGTRQQATPEDTNRPPGAPAGN